MKNKIFIEKARKVHDDKFDYSLVEYVKSNIKVKIICKVHGVFEQKPNNHLSGQGCASCTNTKKSSTEEFIEKSKNVHDEKYNYSLVEYKNANSKVKIICKVHGVFEQIPMSHILGNGCASCTHTKKSSTEEFIEKARKVHNNKFDYSLVDYVKSSYKVKIICKVHGVFEQEANSHLRGIGCCMCYRDKPIQNKSSTEEFIKKSIATHGREFDYSLVEYINKSTKVKIICKVHGVFEQIPSVHLRGFGCSVCSGKKQLTTNDFVDKSIIIHKNIYDYSLVDYKNTNSKVKIICKVHGVFEQKANNHITGSGCPKCCHNISKPETEVFEFVKTLSNTATQSNRKIIKPKELDIYCDVNNIAIEFNGMYWHSSHSIETHEEFKTKHLFKTIECDKLDIRLFHIFENEWNDKKEIWKSILTNAFNKSEFKEVTDSKKVSKTVAKNFFKKNSFEEFNDNSISIGYYSENDLICVLNNDILVYKLYTTSDIQPDVLKINRRFPENLLKYKLIENTEPNPHFHDYKKFVKSENAFMSYANGYSCIWDCGYKIYKG